MATAVKAEKRSECSQVKVGDLMALTYYVEVKRVSAGGTRLNVSDCDNDLAPFEVNGESLIETAYSASQYTRSTTVGKEEAAKLLGTAINVPFSVRFEKQNGQMRTLRGRLVTSEHWLGRSVVEDLDLEVGDHRLRQVDHRTIEWLILNGVRYSVR